MNPDHRSSAKAVSFPTRPSIACARSTIGRSFAGSRYELLEEIGRGGMGLVFRGRDRELDREVAIKVTAWSTDADAERLRAEARTLARLEHPGHRPRARRRTPRRTAASSR